MIYQPLSVWLFSFISLSLFITLLSLCLTLFFLSTSVSPEEAQSDFQGGICWPSVINKDLERQLQFLAGGWGLGAPRQQRRVRKPQPDLQMHFNTHQWLSGSCTSPQILTGKHTLDLPQTDSCQRGSMAKQHSLCVFFSLCLVQIMVPSPWAGVYILCLMWIISLPSLHRKVQWLSKKQNDTVKLGLQCANYSLSLFHLLSFTLSFSVACSTSNLAERVMTGWFYSALMVLGCSNGPHEYLSTAFISTVTIHVD